METSATPRLLDRVHEIIRRKHYSIGTEQAYVDWIKRFILHHDKRHPAELGATEVEAFLTWLAVERGVAASTQNQAQCALLFLYREVLGVDLPWLDEVERARRPIKLPVVLSVDEVVRILEALRLRVKDVDFQRREVLMRDGKGAKDRITALPRAVLRPLRAHLEDVRAIHDQDRNEGFGAVWMPFALARRHPAAPREWAWQYVFPADRRSLDPRGVISPPDRL
jgi:integrase